MGSDRGKTCVCFHHNNFINSYSRVEKRLYDHLRLYLCQRKKIKAAIINIFILTMDQMTVCNVKGVAHSDELTENYCSTLQFLSTLRSFSAPFILLFWFLRPTPLLWFTLAALIVTFPANSRQLFSAVINQLYLLSTKRQTDKVSDWLVNIVEAMLALEAKESDLFLRSWWRPNQS